MPFGVFGRLLFVVSERIEAKMFRTFHHGTCYACVRTERKVVMTVLYLKQHPLSCAAGTRNIVGDFVIRVFSSSLQPLLSSRLWLTHIRIFVVFEHVSFTTDHMYSIMAAIFSFSS